MNKAIVLPKNPAQALSLCSGNIRLELCQVPANGALRHERHQREVPAFAESGTVSVLRDAAKKKKKRVINGSVHHKTKCLHRDLLPRCTAQHSEPKHFAWRKFLSGEGARLDADWALQHVWRLGFDANRRATRQSERLEGGCNRCRNTNPVMNVVRHVVCFRPKAMRSVQVRLISCGMSLYMSDCILT
jgi:hypothetical protein